MVDDDDDEDDEDVDDEVDGPDARVDPRDCMISAMWLAVSIISCVIIVNVKQAERGDQNQRESY